MTEHSFTGFDVQLDVIRTNLARMGSLVEDQIRTAIAAFANIDEQLTEMVIARDTSIDRLEVGIDELCAQAVARQQPAAIDLRLLMGIGKIVTDLERIGDEAKKIARAAQTMRGSSANGWKGRFADIPALGDRVASMLHAALDAFARLDVTAAAPVAQSGQEIEQGFREISRRLVGQMIDDPRTISAALEAILVAKSVERIGDHCRNIALEVIYISSGRDVRHLDLNMLDSELKSR
ncbi:MAG: phosphate signaling complex protein PhoU [Rhodocyclaceae bacterium]|nr:phosphate signaling complex protein PhoU [Rhodocyclaceae bacterium]